MNKSFSEEFFALTPKQRRSVHILLCEHALEKWITYVATQDSIEYVESITGTRQEVDKQLPVDSLASVKENLDTRKVSKRYMEPITAMQDDDLTFPGNITLAYYAIYNLFKKYVQKENIDDWLIVNQALSSENDENLWGELLDNAIQRSQQ